MINEESIKTLNQMLSIISELHKFKGSWKSLGQLSPKKLKTRKKWQLLKVLDLLITLKEISLVINK